MRDGATTFILGAGFSAAAGFPLVRGLRERVVDFLYTDRHPIYDVFLHAGQGFKDGQFAEGIHLVDPDSQLGFEELLNALQIACKSAKASVMSRKYVNKVERASAGWNLRLRSRRRGGNCGCSAGRTG